MAFASNPIFSGPNPEAWISAMERSFFNCRIHPERYVQFAMQFLDGEAQVWARPRELLFLNRGWYYFVDCLLWEFNKPYSEELEEYSYWESKAFDAVQSVPIEDTRGFDDEQLAMLKDIQATLSKMMAICSGVHDQSMTRTMPKSSTTQVMIVENLDLKTDIPVESAVEEDGESGAGGPTDVYHHHEVPESLAEITTQELVSFRREVEIRQQEVATLSFTSVESYLGSTSICDIGNTVTILGNQTLQNRVASAVKGQEYTVTEYQGNSHDDLVLSNDREDIQRSFYFRWEPGPISFNHGLEEWILGNIDSAVGNDNVCEMAVVENSFFLPTKSIQHYQVIPVAAVDDTFAESLETVSEIQQLCEQSDRAGEQRMETVGVTKIGANVVKQPDESEHQVQRLDCDLQTPYVGLSNIVKQSASFILQNWCGMSVAVAGSNSGDVVDSIPGWTPDSYRRQPIVMVTPRSWNVLIDYSRVESSISSGKDLCVAPRNEWIIVSVIMFQLLLYGQDQGVCEYVWNIGREWLQKLSDLHELPVVQAHQPQSFRQGLCLQKSATLSFGEFFSKIRVTDVFHRYRIIKKDGHNTVSLGSIDGTMQTILVGNVISKSHGFILCKLINKIRRVFYPGGFDPGILLRGHTRIFSCNSCAVLVGSCELIREYMLVTRHTVSDVLTNDSTTCSSNENAPGSVCNGDQFCVPSVSVIACFLGSSERPPPEYDKEYNVNASSLNTFQMRQILSRGCHCYMPTWSMTVNTYILKPDISIQGKLKLCISDSIGCTICLRSPPQTSSSMQQRCIHWGEAAKLCDFSKLLFAGLSPMGLWIYPMMSTGTLWGYENWHVSKFTLPLLKIGAVILLQSGHGRIVFAAISWKLSDHHLNVTEVLQVKKQLMTGHTTIFFWEHRAGCFRSWCYNKSTTFVGSTVPSKGNGYYKKKFSALFQAMLKCSLLILTTNLGCHIITWVQDVFSTLKFSAILVCRRSWTVFQEVVAAVLPDHYSKSSDSVVQNQPLLSKLLWNQLYVAHILFPKVYSSLAIYRGVFLVFQDVAPCPSHAPSDFIFAWEPGPSLKMVIFATTVLAGDFYHRPVCVFYAIYHLCYTVRTSIVIGYYGFCCFSASLYVKVPLHLCIRVLNSGAFLLLEIAHKVLTLSRPIMKQSQNSIDDLLLKTDSTWCVSLGLGIEFSIPFIIVLKFLIYMREGWLQHTCV